MILVKKQIYRKPPFCMRFLSYGFIKFM